MNNTSQSWSNTTLKINDVFLSRPRAVNNTSQSWSNTTLKINDVFLSRPKAVNESWTISLLSTFNTSIGNIEQKSTTLWFYCFLSTIFGCQRRPVTEIPTIRGATGRLIPCFYPMQIDAVSPTWYEIRARRPWNKLGLNWHLHWRLWIGSRAGIRVDLPQSYKNFLATFPEQTFQAHPR